MLYTLSDNLNCTVIRLAVWNPYDASVSIFFLIRVTSRRRHYSLRSGCNCINITALQPVTSGWSQSSLRSGCNCINITALQPVTSGRQHFSLRSWCIKRCSGKEGEIAIEVSFIRMLRAIYIFINGRIVSSFDDGHSLLRVDRKKNIGNDGRYQFLGFFPPTYISYLSYGFLLLIWVVL